ncbi:hypothetical protein MTO96_001618 [Rhipicephalus appendiculatus]
MDDNKPHRARRHQCDFCDYETDRPCHMWNTNSLWRRHFELKQRLLQDEFDVLALQEVYITSGSLRLPGFFGYCSTTSCTVSECSDVPCLVDGHPQDAARCAVYVCTSIPNIVVRVDDLTSGLLELTVRLGSWETTVASFYVRPNKPWNASSLLPVAARLGRDFLLCGDLNATVVGHARKGRAPCHLELRGGGLDSFQVAGRCLQTPRKPTMEAELGKVSAVPSPALGAVQVRGGFCGRYSMGQPSVDGPCLSWQGPSSSGLSELALADLMASQFAGRPPGIPAEARLSDGLVHVNK